ncbi:MAG: glycoside hydrolase family 3 protein [Hyphomicrobiales bacterium]|nr:glycoside hydrolase family 3 protein [Hyphomicrobiales bacterium]
MAFPVRLVAVVAVLVSAGAGAEGYELGAAQQRAEAVLGRMTQAEKLSLVRGGLGAPWGGRPKPQGSVGSAGYVAGIPRLGIPALQETDAELGIANPGNIRPGDTATAMPSDLALASTWDLGIARRQGAAVGAEARAKGFNVLLGGAVNLIRDPRGGRDFEYFSEDPLLAGLMAGAAIDGVQSRHVLSTIKHFALNDQETDRVALDARIDRAAARESDLLAFEIGIEQGRPGAVMCAYNEVNGVYSCENDWLLDRVLKADWRYPGFVMSDWGAVHSTIRSAVAGLDQESGDELDTQNFFESLGRSVAEGKVPQTRLDDMARRILTSIFTHGLAEEVASDPADSASSEESALAIEREGAVLLKNEGLLPLPTNVRRLLVVGAHADRGVPSGGGSSQVVPRGGIAFSERVGRNRAMIFDPSSPLDAIRRQFPHALVDYDDGRFPGRAANAARWADAVILFADQWRTEGIDAPSLSLPGGQDTLMETAARANPHSVVVLETGGPVLMPWLDETAAVVEAWYPGQKGGEAIAEFLSGAVNPSGRLPLTFPKSEAQLPHPTIQGDPTGAPIGPVGRGGHYDRTFVAQYGEGAEVGYKWYFERGEQPLFPFGFGLSYTTFGLRSLSASADGARVTVRATVWNSGARAGVATPEFYVSGPAGANIPLRLAGWSRVDLAPGKERDVSASVDPRLLATFDEGARRWRIRGGDYRITAGFDVERREAATAVHLDGAELPP